MIYLRFPALWAARNGTYQHDLFRLDLLKKTYKKKKRKENE